MIVHIIGSASQIAEDYPYIDTIAQVTLSGHNTIALNWYDAANKESIRRVPKKSLNWNSIVESQLKAISRSDLIIIEASHYGFSHGFLAAHSLLANKPVLFLYRSGSNKWKDLSELFVSGISSDLFVKKVYYGVDDLTIIVKEFLDNFTHLAEVNLQINERDKTQLEKLASRREKSISAVVHDLLQTELRR